MSFAHPGSSVLCARPLARVDKYAPEQLQKRFGIAIGNPVVGSFAAEADMVGQHNDSHLRVQFLNNSDQALTIAVIVTG